MYTPYVYSKTGVYRGIPRPRRGGSNEYPQPMFWSKNKKNYKIFPMKVSIFASEKISLYTAWASFCSLIQEEHLRVSALNTGNLSLEGFAQEPYRYTY